MKLQSIALPLLALAGATLLLSDRQAEAYSTISGTLSHAQRDVRVYDNFLDLSANDNVAADANFPGYTGVEMACWKGTLEWSSGLHGNGNGDPHQVGGLGSGGANFDPSWQGNAIGVGGTNDNIISSLNANGGGVLAYTETPISDGWRIRFYENWTWADGPGTNIPASQIDVQGVLCHEYGHALGLGHSTVGGSTMYPSISGTGVVTRSIATDDSNGVKAKYGTKAATKPNITGYSKTGTSLTVTGNNFSPTGNEVWFTQAGSGGTGQPIKVTGVLSVGGTSISVTVPATAGKGDILVRNNGTAAANLSNAWPYAN